MFFEILVSLLILLLLAGGGGGILYRQRFSARLKKELPVWIDQGWVSPEGGEKILASALSAKKHSVSTAFSILGVLLFGAGVITFFAANWDEISKLTKLSLLFGAMWAAFAGAAWCRSHEMHHWLSESILLLGAILFGSNIMLIAQIYHIDSHYPDGVMVWGLGALLTAWLLASKPVFVFSVALATLWSAMEANGFHHFHWQFLTVWGLHVAVMIRHGWSNQAHLLMLSFMLWTIFSYAPLDRMAGHGSDVYLMQAYFLFYLNLFVIGMHLLLDQRSEYFGEVVQKQSALAALACFYILTFPDFLRSRRWVDGGFDLRAPADNLWLWITLVLIALLAGFAIAHRKRSGEKGVRQGYHNQGMLLLAAILSLLLSNIFLLDHSGGGESGGAVAVAFNLLYFASLIWLIFFGMHRGNQPLVNLAFFFFALALLSRYFDTFWELLDRSLFFMGGGVLVVALGIFLEKRRRTIVAGMREGGES